MFSSPGGVPPRRTRGFEAESVGGSVRSSRAGTPSAAASRIAGPSRHHASALRSSRASVAPSRASYMLEEGSDGASVATANANDYGNRFRAPASKNELVEGTTLCRDDVMDIAAFSRMPREAKEELDKASPYDPLNATLDPVTGYAQLVTRDRCYIWAYVTPSYEAPPCFEFESLPSSSKQSIQSRGLTLCCQIPRGKDREPGVLLVSPSGLVRFHSSLSSARTSHKQGESTFGLSGGEIVTRLHRTSTEVIVAATSQLRLFSIHLSASSGSIQPEVTPFAQSRSFLGRFFAAAPSAEQAQSGSCSLVSRQNADDSLDVFATNQKTVQRWSVSGGKGERLVSSDDVQALLGTCDQRITAETPSSDSLRLYDLAVIGEGSLVALYGFVLREHGPVHYGLASFKVGQAEMSLASSQAITHSKLADARPYAQPRLVLPFGGSAALVVLSEAIIVRSLDHNGFEEVVELRDAPNNRIIGSSCEGIGFEAPRDVSRATIVLQSIGTVLVTIDTKAVAQIAHMTETSNDRSRVDTRRLKSKLERGIFHSNTTLNPISFDLPAEISGDLISAAEQLSDDVVRSASPGLANVVEMRLHLTTRLEKLHSLVVFLSSNGRLGLLSQNCLRRLCADAQLVAAAVDLWDLQNELGNNRGGYSDTILYNALERTMGTRSRPEDDLSRAFFRTRLRDLVSLLQHIRAIVEENSAAGIIGKSATIQEGNNVLLTALQASSRYRRETLQLYRLDESKVSIESWCCADSVVQIIHAQAVSTEAVIGERTRQLGSFVDIEQGDYLAEAADEESKQQRMQQVLKGQLYELVAASLAVYEERLHVLRVAVGVTPSMEREYTKLEASYLAERSKLIKSLVTYGRLDRALLLAEEHHDFTTLAQLVSVLPAQQRDYRIQIYSDKYDKVFATALFTHYVDEGQMHTLLVQNDRVNGILKEYLDVNPGLSRVAWLHDLTMGEASNASKRLIQQSHLERSSIASKKLMLSVAKLCHVSNLSEMQIATQSEQTAIETFDDQLDLVNVHNRLREVFAVDNDGDEMEAVGVLLQEVKPGFKELLVKLCDQLFAGKVLLPEDLIDLLTLHDPTETSHADFALAIEVYVRAKDIPQVRADGALAALWRRVLLFDDWSAVTQTANLSDEQIRQRLQGTALYQMMLSAAGNESTAGIILQPAQCTIVPPLEGLQARIAEAMLPLSSAADDGDAHATSRALLGQLMQDYHSEVFELQDLIASNNLEQWYAEIQRLVQEALSAQAQGERAVSEGLSLSGMSQMSDEVIAM